MSEKNLTSTLLTFENRVLCVSDESVANLINKDVLSPVSEENVPGGIISDVQALESFILSVYPSVKIGWKILSEDITSSSLVLPDDGEMDDSPYRELRRLASEDMSGVVLLALSREISAQIRERDTVGSILNGIKQKVDNLLRVLPTNVDARVSMLSEYLLTFSNRISVRESITTLQRKSSGITVLSPFHAPVFFSEYSGLSLYYSVKKEYIIEVNGLTMTISQYGYFVSCDDGFDGECEKLKFRVVRLDETEARAVLTLARVLQGKLEGDKYKIWYDEKAQVGQSKYIGFNDFDLRTAYKFKSLILPALEGGGGIVNCDKDWHHYSKPHLAFLKFFRDKLLGNLAPLVGIQNFFDSTCVIKASVFSESVHDLTVLRKQWEAKLLSHLTSSTACLEYTEKVASFMKSIGAGCGGKTPNKLSATKNVHFIHPTFAENSARLKAGRALRNKDPGSSLFKQYPVCPGGPAIQLGEATARKVADMLATLSSVGGPDVLSGCTRLLYSGVTNYDRMLEVICEKWIASHPDLTKDGALELVTLLDKAHASPPRWSLAYGDYKFSLRSTENPKGQFVCTDLVKYLNGLDVTKGRSDLIISDANVLGTDDDNYLTKNEFTAADIDLGSQAIEDWLTKSKEEMSPSGVATAKYLIKCASKFRSGIIKVHIFDLKPKFFLDLGNIIHTHFKADSFLWKNGRGHNNEYYFYFFPSHRRYPLYMASTLYIPVLLSAVAVSEITRHIAYYVPHRLYGNDTFPAAGYLGVDPNFPVIVPSFYSCSFEEFNIGGTKFVGIRGLRTGLKTLVAGIHIPSAKEDDEFVDVQFFDVDPTTGEETVPKDGQNAGTSLTLNEESPKARKIVPLRKALPGPTSAEAYVTGSDTGRLGLVDKGKEVVESDSRQSTSSSSGTQEDVVYATDKESEEKKRERLNVLFD